MNLLTNSFMNDCGRLFGPSEQCEADSRFTAIRISSYIPAIFEDSVLRLRIYDEIVRTAETPVVAMIARLVGASPTRVRKIPDTTNERGNSQGIFCLRYSL
jgi:hypothetical protein